MNSLLSSGVHSAGASPAGHDPPAAAAGGGARRSAGEEGRRDPGLQRERRHAQQRYARRSVTRNHVVPVRDCGAKTSRLLLRWWAAGLVVTPPPSPPLTLASIL